jgi:formamidopyrimidine-DNA glycosylase
MPELPEVETVRKTLIDWCKNKTIKNVDLFYKNVLSNIEFNNFKNKIINQKINDIDRFGKYLFFILDDYVLISHLRMEGKYFFVNEENDYIKKHKIITFTLDDGNLIYHDVRKFGKMKLVDKGSYMLDESIVKLGKEPFTISKEELYNKIHHLNKKIKQSLLDQTIISGLGNIYVDEVLFDASISPNRSSKDITLKECEKIIQSSIQILNKAIKLKGSTIATYHFNNNEAGDFKMNIKFMEKKAVNVVSVKV